MVGWHHWLDGHEFEQLLGNSEGQGSLACCSPWGHKGSDMTEWQNLIEWLNWTDFSVVIHKVIIQYVMCCTVFSCSVLSDFLWPLGPQHARLVLYHLLELAQTHVYWVGDAIQPSRPLSPPSPLALSLSKHQGLFQWVSSSHQVAKLLELQLQHQSFQRIFKTDFL